jgi:hypothetical protein
MFFEGMMAYGDRVVDVKFYFAEDEFFVCHCGDAVVYSQVRLHWI